MIYFTHIITISNSVSTAYVLKKNKLTNRYFKYSPFIYNNRIDRMGFLHF
jgi:hypothetical protein